MKYVKVMFGSNSGANKNINYKIDEVNIANNWNPNTLDPKEMGGFNFSTYDKVFRWLIRGDTIYDVEIPDDTEVINCPSESAPNGVFRSNKIILHNPRIITDELAYDLYKKSNLPKKSYYKSLAGCAIRGYKDTCIAIIKDKINKDNIDLVLSEIDDFVTPYKSNGTSLNGIELYEEVMEYLQEVKSDLLISRFVDKEPYIKEISNDKVINLSGESGSGKSYYSNKYLNNNDYIVIDTDIIFGDYSSDNKESLEIRELFKNKENDSFVTNFDECYKEILDYFKDTNKTIVIDSAQFRNIKDISILKGKVIVMRTSIEVCYKRVLNRWKIIMNNNYDEEDFNKYAKRKLGMFSWYKSLNDFLEKIDNIQIKE